MFAIGLELNSMALRAQAATGGGMVAPISAVAADGWQATMVTPTELAFAPVAVSRQGFDATGAGTTLAETLYTGKRVRQPYPNQATLTASAVALTDYLFATDTIAGVTNSSALVSPKPIAAWIMPDALLVQTQVHWEIAAFHYNARDGRQVAAVRVRANNGTVATAWQTISTPTISSFVEDANPVPCHQGDLDVSALADGPFWLEAEVFPHVGGAASVMKSEDNYAAGGAFRHFTRRWFRKGAVPAYCYVASTGNDTTGAANADAATAATTPCLTVAGALKKLHDLRGAGSNGTLDGCRIRVVDSVAAGTVTFTGSYKQDVAAVVIERAPGTSRAAAVVSQSVAFTPDFDSHSYTVNGAAGIEGRLLITDCTWRMTAATIFTGSASPLALLHVTFWNAALDQNSQNTNLRANAHLSFFGTSVTGIAATGHALASSPTLELRIMRGVTADLALQALAGGCTIGSTLSRTNGHIFIDTAAGFSLFAFNRHLSPNGANPAITIEDMANAATASTLAPIAVVQNLVEWTSATSNPALRIAGDADEGNITHAVIHHNSCAGDGLYGRWNLFYDEDATVARDHRLISFIGNLGTQLNTKGDLFMANGARLGQFAFTHGVGCEGTYTISPTGGGTPFEQSWPGRYSLIANGSPLFTDNRATTAGPVAGAGGGTYTLQAGSPARGLVARRVLSHDLAGTARPNGAQHSGAYA